jgi:hypothetical protein
MGYLTKVKAAILVFIRWIGSLSPEVAQEPQFVRIIQADALGLFRLILGWWMEVKCSANFNITYCDSTGSDAVSGSMYC